jgi:hypothetical protein
MKISSSFVSALALGSMFAGVVACGGGGEGGEPEPITAYQGLFRYTQIKINANTCPTKFAGQDMLPGVGDVFRATPNTPAAGFVFIGRCEDATGTVCIRPDEVTPQQANVTAGAWSYESGSITYDQSPSVTLGEAPATCTLSLKWTGEATLNGTSGEGRLSVSITSGGGAGCDAVEDLIKAGDPEWTGSIASCAGNGTFQVSKM